ncbi:hypothetical protein PAXRUDRAFT_835859 [Paxillus rubicundulus Ve08.2h10]|uniref:Uncharacterized protein n=1 Tax=Paxillus rubicundulus Ve08.2h10 TaxID=930991 RepID=A0A0D0CI97_9AGAM|nr:hypothetical protein PAXRUDRAFT_835859 [Paxillus rubicundulus Ve08.2h10]
MVYYSSVTFASVSCVMSANESVKKFLDIFTSGGNHKVIDRCARKGAAATDLLWHVAENTSFHINWTLAFSREQSGSSKKGA